MRRPPTRRDFRFELVVVLTAFVVWRTGSSAPVFPLAAVLYALTGRSAADLDAIGKAFSSTRDGRQASASEQPDVDVESR